MDRCALSLAVLVLLAGRVVESKAANPRAGSFDYEPLERVLQAYVDSKGLVDYRALQHNRKDLDEMVRRMERLSPANAPELFPSRDAQLAYWINAYNTLVLRMVVDHYPISSITKVGLIPFGAFFVKHVELGGKKLTLRRLENDVVREGFHDPRIHFAINCASRSCPPLAQHVYLSKTLDQQLDAAARRFINDNREVTLDEAGNRIVLSKIFDWYASDFKEADTKLHGEGTVVDYLKLYLTPDRQKVLQRLPNAKVGYHDYDWGLNGQGTGG